MINFLFNLLLITTLLVAFVIVLIGAIWVLSFEINTMLDVDILFNLKRKVRKIVYDGTEEICFPNRNNKQQETEEH